MNAGFEESFTCEDDSKTLSCPAGQGIVIDFANYGRTSHPVCVQDQERDKPNNCFTPSHTNFIATFCNGQSSCVVPATNSFFGDTCPGVIKYLQIHYHCSGPVGPDSTSTSSGSEYFSTPAPDGSYYAPSSDTPLETSSRPSQVWSPELKPPWFEPLQIMLLHSFRKCYSPLFKLSI